MKILQTQLNEGVFAPLKIQDIVEFGKIYKDTIEGFVDAYNLGTYIGYSLSPTRYPEKTIEIIGNDAILTISYALTPIRIRTVYQP